MLSECYWGQKLFNVQDKLLKVNVQDKYKYKCGRCNTTSHGKINVILTPNLWTFRHFILQAKYEVW